MSILLRALAREAPFSDVIALPAPWDGSEDAGISPSIVLLLCLSLPLIGLFSGSVANVLWRHAHPPLVIARLSVSPTPLVGIIKDAILDPPSLFLPHQPPVSAEPPSSVAQRSPSPTRSVVPRRTGDGAVGEDARAARPPLSAGTSAPLQDIPSTLRAPSVPEPSSASVQPPEKSPAPGLNWQAQISFAGGSAQGAVQAMPTITERSNESLRQLLPDGGMSLATALYQDITVLGAGAARPQVPLTGMDSAKLRSALALLMETEQAKPNQPVTIAQIGLVLAAVGDNEKAIEYLRKAEKFAPDNPAFRLFNALQLERLGQVSAALVEYREAYRLIVEAEGWRYPLPVSLSDIVKRIERLSVKAS